jgi:hypothetical protein
MYLFLLSPEWLYSGTGVLNSDKLSVCPLSEDVSLSYWFPALSDDLSYSYWFPAPSVYVNNNIHKSISETRHLYQSSDYEHETCTGPDSSHGTLHKSVPWVVSQLPSAVISTVDHPLRSPSLIVQILDATHIFQACLAPLIWSPGMRLVKVLTFAHDSVHTFAHFCGGNDFIFVTCVRLPKYCSV